MKTDVEFKGIKDDLIFKFLFSHKEILIDLINSYLNFINEDKHVYVEKIEPQKAILADKYIKKDFYSDLMVTLNTGEIIIIEMYTIFNIRQYKKSCHYTGRVYSNQMDIGEEDFEKAKKVINLNFIYGNYRRANKELVNIYDMRHHITKKVIDNGEMEIVLIRVDLIKKIPYNQNEKRFLTWLRILDSTSMMELEDLVKGDEIMEHSLAYVKRYLNSNLNRTFEDYVHEKSFEAAEKAAAEATAKAEQERNTEIAKNLLSLGTDINTISKATGLSVKQIKLL